MNEITQDWLDQELAGSSPSGLFRVKESQRLNRNLRTPLNSRLYGETRTTDDLGRSSGDPASLARPATRRACFGSGCRQTIVQGVGRRPRTDAQKAIPLALGSWAVLAPLAWRFFPMIPSEGDRAFAFLSVLCQPVLVGSRRDTVALCHSCRGAGLNHPASL